MLVTAGLNERGIEKFEAFMKEYARPEVGYDYFSWHLELTFDSTDAFRFELIPYYSKSDRTETLILDREYLEIIELDDT